MKNMWVICVKELRTYFVSPIAYILFIIYAGLFGWFFWNSVGLFIYYSMESQMRGEMFPMNINDQIVRQVLGDMNVVIFCSYPLLRCVCSPEKSAMARTSCWRRLRTATV